MTVWPQSCKTSCGSILIPASSWSFAPSAATKRQLKDLAQTLEVKSDLAKVRRVRLRPGARLIREWRGETHEVLVTEDGFLWRGENWRSLSVIAREMTGTRWSGPRFFGLDKSAPPLAGVTKGLANE